MRYMKDINIGKSVIHVVDPLGNDPLLANRVMKLDSQEIEFITSHITKTLSDEESKCCRVVSDKREVYKSIVKILNNRETLVEESKKIAENYFKVIKKYEGIPAGDILFSLFFSQGKEYLAIMKLDYTELYKHQVEYSEDGLEISLSTESTGLPSSGQKLKKCAFFKKNDDGELQVLALNKFGTYESDEIKNYFTFEVLGIDPVEDSTSLTRKIKPVVEKFARKNLRDDIEKATKLRDRVDYILINDSTVEISEIIEDVFKENEKYKDELLIEAGKCGITPGGSILLDKVLIEKKMRTKQLKTDTGITLKADYDILSDSSKFETKINGDGSVDYILKNIRNVTC